MGDGQLRSNHRWYASRESLDDFVPNRDEAQDPEDLEPVDIQGVLLHIDQ